MLDLNNTNDENVSFDKLNELINLYEKSIEIPNMYIINEDEPE